VLIFSEHISPRLQYVVNFIFKDVLGTGVEIISDKESFLGTDEPKISYTRERIGNELNIIPSGFLSGEKITEIKPESGLWENLKTIFPVSVESDIPFDLFAGVFYLISRYEEYLPFEGDKYGRFKAEESLAYKNGFLDQAIVDRWILMFSNILKNKYPALNFPGRNFVFIPTVDVDMPYEFLFKGTGRCLGGAAKSILRGEFSRLRERYDVVTGKREDAFYTFSKIREVHKTPGLITFFLTAGYGKYDKGIDPSLEEFRKMVSEVSLFSFTGIHPSWESNMRTNLLEKEISTLESIAGKSITRSRQHYLVLDFPQTYQRLLASGIKEDYSMGFASAAGFRAGTCTPFHFYDLMKEAETQLVIYPFQVMDRTLKDYMKLQPIDAIRKINELIEEVRSVNGNFISIWHNDTFSDIGEWKGWPEVYEKLLSMVQVAV
jgi:hypothetical protein